MQSFFRSISSRSHLGVFILLWFLTGCTAFGDWVAGATHKSPGIAYPEQLETVQIGVTTKEDVRHLFGAPTDLQVSSVGGLTRESWAYASTHSKINPLQYVPGVGVLALSKKIPRHSFAISFSPEGTVEGIGIREFQSFDLDLSQKKLSGSPSGHMSYGMNNPLTHHPR